MRSSHDEAQRENRGGADMKVKKPCVGCVYFNACGSTTRTEPCKGRKTKRQMKNEQ